MSTAVRRSYLLLHLSVFLWGFTAILGAWITLSATVLVWWRVALTSIVMLMLPGVVLVIRRLSWSMIKIYAGIGVVIALHWVCFYGSIKMANASVALICMSTASLFTSFIEPWMTRKPFKWIDLGFGLLIIPGIILTTQGMSWDMMSGFWVGILSAALAALFAVLNKKYINESTPAAITAIEMVSAGLFLTLCYPLYYLTQSEARLIPDLTDFVLLLILAVVCTVIPFILHLKAFEHLTAFASNLIVNLEPVYGILLAIVLLHEHHELTTQFYLGVLVILFSVLTYPMTRKWRATSVYDG